MIIDKTKKYVLKLCENSDIRWRYHIVSTVKYAKLLSDRFGANTEVVELASWLHDIASIKGIKIDHHIKGAQLAEELLLKAGCDKKIIKEVVNCILSHAEDENFVPSNMEQKIVISADGLSDFDHFDLTSYRFFLLHSPPEKARAMILDKYERAFLKIMPEARDLVLPRYEAIKTLLENE